MPDNPTPAPRKEGPLERCEKAMKMVSDLNNKRREWMMSIPPDFDYDCDLVIHAALEDIAPPPRQGGMF